MPAWNASVCTTPVQYPGLRYNALQSEIIVAHLKAERVIKAAAAEALVAEGHNAQRGDLFGLEEGNLVQVPGTQESDVLGRLIPRILQGWGVQHPCIYLHKHETHRQSPKPCLISTAASESHRSRWNRQVHAQTLTSIIFGETVRLNSFGVGAVRSPEVLLT